LVQTLKKAGRWIADRLKDLLYDSNNGHLDNGRCIAALSLMTLIGATVWNMHIHKEIALSDLGTGMAAILTALVVYVYHDRKTNGS
jgi:hypothetical protein